MRIFPLGESALTVEFGDEMLPELNSKALNLVKYLEQHPFPGFVESVSAYSSTTIFYEIASVRKHFDEFPSAFDAIRHLVEDMLSKMREHASHEVRPVEIPVRFDARSALDLAYLGEFSGFSTDKVIEIFLDRIYRVYMLGFLPGFAYMGEVDDLIAAPRKQTPRLKVPKGSVGIAGGQTGIYPLDSPGGWQIIGRTETEMFTPDGDDPCFLRSGDSVKFTRID